MKLSLTRRTELMASFLAGKVSKQETAQLLGCTARTVENYRRRYYQQGAAGLADHRHSNFFRLSDGDRNRIVDLKKVDRWRSARNVRDKLEFRVHEITVWRVFKKEGLVRENVERLKPLRRFEADRPNDLWQTDIMGRIVFPKLGALYLIATLDDHSRFCLASRWFKSQNKINVFLIWYESLSHWGLPKVILQDEGSQYKARARFGIADYQWYARALGIDLIWARRAQTKGKIERFWRFVQTDFCKEVWGARSLEEINTAFKQWVKRYNYQFKSRYFAGETRSSRYRESEKRVDQAKLRSLLAIEEQRKVTRESTISLYGNYYSVPPNYIGRRIWVKIIGNKLIFEANGTVFWKTRLKPL